MDNKDIRELAAIMREMGLTSLEYQSGGDLVKLARMVEKAQSTAAEPDTEYAFQNGDETPQGNAFTVKSPIVGVYYAAPGPDAEPYVALGDSVLVGDVLCVIEAMKIMNEITSERDGVITEIFVEDKEVVEFGQPLFRIGS